MELWFNGTKRVTRPKRRGFGVLMAKLIWNYMDLILTVNQSHIKMLIDLSKISGILQTSLPSAFSRLDDFTFRIYLHWNVFFAAFSYDTHVSSSYLQMMSEEYRVFVIHSSPADLNMLNHKRIDSPNAISTLPRRLDAIGPDWWG